MIKKKIENCKYPLAYDYYVTDDGRVWSEKSHKFMALSKDKDGYVKVALRSLDLPPKKCHRFSVHRLVMENFYPFHHAMKTGLRAETNGAAKLNTKQVIEIYQRAKNGEKNVALGKEFHIHPDTVGKIRNKRTWKDLLKDY